MASDWYAARLRARQRVEVQLWQRHIQYLERFVAKSNYADEVERLGVRARLSLSRVRFEQSRRPERIAELQGTNGAEPSIGT
jgi:hypothetical protein